MRLSHAAPIGIVCTLALCEPSALRAQETPPATVKDPISSADCLKDKKKAPECQQLGLAYLTGTGVAQDVDRGVALLDAACRASLPSACGTQGWVLLRRHASPEDVKRGRALLDKECQRGASGACMFLGRAYAEGTGVARDVGRAVEPLETACTSGQEGACMILAKLLDAGDGIARDAERAKRLLERACGLGLEEGCETACDAGSGSACVSLGNRLARAKEPDAGRIDHAYECACKAGAAAGCYYLGWRTTDPERSLPLFERACSLNDEAGCVAAAQCYQLGRGVEIDLAQAASLYAKACERGDASGCLYLGAIYARGELGASEAQKGKTYLTKACSCCDDVECRAIVANGGIPKSWGGSLEDLRPDRAGKGDWDQPPRLLRGTRPDYPPRAFQNRIQGTVMLEISIDEMGAVSEARVVESIPALDQAAIDCVQQWRFSPARRGGVAVPTLARAPITFSITDDHGRSSAGRK